jgi:hypothetical protein
MIEVPIIREPCQGKGEWLTLAYVRVEPSGKGYPRAAYQVKKLQIQLVAVQKECINVHEF